MEFKCTVACVLPYFLSHKRRDAADGRTDGRAKPMQRQRPIPRMDGSLWAVAATSGRGLARAR